MLSEATMEMTDLAMAQDARQADEDKRLLVVFSRRPWHNKEKSALEGRPIYDERDYITIMVPGDKDSIVERPANDMDKQRFYRQYDAFTKKMSQELSSGTPLRAVSFLTAAQVKELEYFNCYTVEQLAGLSDARAQGFMGIQSLKRMAQDFLTAAKEQAPLTAMRAELEQRDATIADQARTIKDLSARIDALEAEED